MKFYLFAAILLASFSLGAQEVSPEPNDHIGKEPGVQPLSTVDKKMELVKPYGPNAKADKRDVNSRRTDTVMPTKNRPKAGKSVRGKKSQDSDQ